MNRAVTIGLLVGLAIVAVLAWWIWFRDDAPPAEELPPVVWPLPGEEEVITDPIEPPAEDTAPEPDYPVPEPDEAEAAAEPLPPLEKSDAPLRQALEEAAPDRITRLLVPSQLVNRFVVTVNSLDGAKMAPLRMWPLRHVPGVPEVTEIDDDRYRWSQDNYARYTSYVRAFTAVDAATLVRIYRRFYPLLQEAWVELGLPQRQFNDRVIEIIDHLLAAPATTARPTLVRPEVLYRYADRDVEALSSGHKIMLRIGPDNAAVVRQQLRAIRAELVAG